MYTFLFDRRSLALFLGGLGAAGLLTFAAGMLVGLKVQLPTQTVQTAAFEPLSAFEGGFIKSAEALPFERSAPEVPLPRVAEGLDRTKDMPAATTPAPKESPAADPVASRLRPSVVPESEAKREDVGDKAAERSSRIAQARPPAPERVVAPRAAEPTPPTSYFVQIGAYRLESTARGRAAALAAEGFEAEVVRLPRPVGGDLMTVRLGTFPTRQEAVAQANEYVTRAPGREAVVREAS